MIHSIQLGSRKMITDFSIGASIGDILEHDTLSGTLVGTGSNVGDEIPNFQHFIKKDIDGSDLVTTNGTNVTVNFNATAKLPEVAEGDLQVSFNQSKSEYIALKNIMYEELDFLNIEPLLNDYWKKHGLDRDISSRHRYLLVTMVQHADSGIYLYSEHSNINVGIKANGNIPVDNISIVLGGDVTFEHSIVTNIISKKPITKIFQVRHNLLVGNWPIFF